MVVDQHTDHLEVQANNLVDRIEVLSPAVPRQAQFQVRLKSPVVKLAVRVQRIRCRLIRDFPEVGLTF